MTAMPCSCRLTVALEHFPRQQRRFTACSTAPLGFRISGFDATAKDSSHADEQKAEGSRPQAVAVPRPLIPSLWAAGYLLVPRKLLSHGNRSARMSSRLNNSSIWPCGRPIFGIRRPLYLLRRCHPCFRPRGGAFRRDQNHPTTKCNWGPRHRCRGTAA